jgi:hypothetical protein
VWVIGILTGVIVIGFLPLRLFAGAGLAYDGTYTAQSTVWFIMPEVHSFTDSRKALIILQCDLTTVSEHLVHALK